MVSLRGSIRHQPRHGKRDHLASLPPLTNSKGIRNTECTLLEEFISGSVNEQLVAFYGQCPFCQFVPAKFSQYGVKM